MKSVIIKLFVVLFSLSLFVSNVMAQRTVKKAYLKVAEENIRDVPKGKKIGSILEGTQLYVLEEKDNWVKVTFTGWIWKESLGEFKIGTTKGEFHALHILVKTRAEAEEILKQLNTGAKFEELAKAKSISPSAAKGGDLGFFDSGDFGTEIQNAIAALKIGQISGVIQTAHGYNIFKRLK